MFDLTKFRTLFWLAGTIAYLLPQWLFAQNLVEEWSVKGQASTPLKIVTDKLRSYQAALRELAPSLPHITDQYENNRAEVSHQPGRQQERHMRRFKSPGQAQRFLSFHALVNNLFRRQRHLLYAGNYRVFRDRSFTTWGQVSCVY